MQRTLLAFALLLAAPLAACGPDCDKFCQHWVRDCPDVSHATDFGHCVQACDEVGSDNQAFISCVADKSCAELRAGHCVIPSVLPGIVQ